LDVTWFVEIYLMNGLGKLCSVGARKPTQTIFFPGIYNVASPRNRWYEKSPEHWASDIFGYAFIRQNNARCS